MAANVLLRNAQRIMKLVTEGRSFDNVMKKVL